MAKNSGGGWGWLIVAGLLVGGVIVTRKGAELQRDINALVGELNRRYGKRWVSLGTQVLSAYLKTTPFGPALRLLNIVVEVERMSQQTRMTGSDKLQAAVIRALNPFQ